MKDYLILTLKFLLFATIFYVGILFLSGWLLPDFLRPNLLFQSSGVGYSYKRMVEAETYGHTDIVFLGSSRAYRGFDTRIFAEAGYRTFNLGTSNQTPVQSYYLLKKYIPGLKPKIVIFEVNPDIFSNDGVESSIDIISNTDPDIGLLKMSLEVKNIKVVNGLIFSACRKFFGLSLLDFDYKNKNHKYIQGGYVESLDRTYRKNEGNAYYCNIMDKQLQYLDRIAEMMKTEGITMIFVQAPVTKKLYTSCSENKRFDTIISSKGCQYYNFNEWINLTDSIHFADGQHLNQKGVELFNKAVINLCLNTTH